MAVTTLGNVDGVVDRRQTQGSATQKLATPADYADVDAMRTALTTAGYTSANLDLMTVNDMIYALRLANDSAGI